MLCLKVHQFLYLLSIQFKCSYFSALNGCSFIFAKCHNANLTICPFSVALEIKVLLTTLALIS